MRGSTGRGDSKHEIRRFRNDAPCASEPASGWGNPARRYQAEHFFRGYGIRVSVLTFRSASERAALRLPRVVKTHSGAPEPQVSRPPDGLSPRASFPDHPRARHPTPQPFPALLVSERRKAHSSSRRPAAVKKHAPASRAGRVHRGCMAGPTYTYVDTPPRAFLGPHALTPAPPPRFRPKQRLPKTSLAESPFRSSGIE